MKKTVKRMKMSNYKRHMYRCLECIHFEKCAIAHLITHGCLGFEKKEKSHGKSR